jgi:hypothetical protein
MGFGKMRCESVEIRWLRTGPIAVPLFNTVPYKQAVRSLIICLSTFNKTEKWSKEAKATPGCSATEEEEKKWS